MTIQVVVGVVLTIAGLIPIGLQLALQIGWIAKNIAPTNSFENMVEPAAAVKFLATLLDRAGWMVVVGLILIYIGVRCLGVTLFGVPGTG